MCPSRNWAANGESTAYHATITRITNLLVLNPLLQPPLTGHLPSVIPPGIRVVGPVELGAPHLNDVREPLKKDQLDLLVQFCDPVFKVRVTFQV